MTTNLETGAVTPQTRQVIRVGTGLNYLDEAGAWQQSEDLIELTTDGGAAAVHGPHKVYFSAAGLNDDAALTIVTVSNRVFQARVLGIYYFDPASGQGRLLAAPSDHAVAELHPPNQIVYRSAFHSHVLKADLRYTYTKSGFESEVILTAQPKLSPSDCGFDPAGALLQVRHQWLAPAPRIRTVTVGTAAGPELTDQLLDFGDLWFPGGRAFSTGGRGRTDTNVAARIIVASPGGGGAHVPVGKQWEDGGATNTLIESVSWTSIAPELAGLPLIANADPPDAGTQLAGAPDQGLFLQTGLSAWSGIKLAGAPYETLGLAVDYNTISIVGNYQDYTFQTFVPNTGPEYEIDENFGSAYFSGTVTFRPGCVIKCVYGPYIMISGGVVCNGSQASPSIITSWFDNQYGFPYDYGGTPSAGDIGTGLILYYIGTNVTLKGLCIRYATTALECDGNTPCQGVASVPPALAAGPQAPDVPGGLLDVLENSAVYSCQTGVYANHANVYFENSDAYLVTTQSVAVCGIVSGGFGPGAPPAPPTLSTCEAVQLSNNVTLYSSYARPTVVDWYLYTGQPGRQIYQVGTGPNLTLSGTQVLTNYGSSYGVYAGVSNPFGSNYAQFAALVVTTPYQIDVLDYFLAATNGKVASLWADMPITNQPTGMAWNTDCLIYGVPGFTAICQANNWTAWPFCGCPGEASITALTARHGYASGHTFGGRNGLIDMYQETGAYPPVWFCTASSQVVTNYIRYAFGRYTGDGQYDYIIFMFTNDLPQSITPMNVGYYPQEPTVLLRTCQAATGPGGQPGSVAAFGPSTECAVSPFNYFSSYQPGDSGSPNMVLTPDNWLVFVGGTSTTGPCDQMQADMDYLCTNSISNLGLNPANYKMQWHQTE